jgi:putative ubiquitin-RnfH superfamily antitoxin RatB of RatAB toxin-antitoxin module
MAPAELRIEVVYCPGPGMNDLSALRMAEGATVADALRASGVLQRHGLSLESARLGVWSKPREADSPLRDHDRVEIYRPLTVDPKEARRLRYKRHRDNGDAAVSGSPKR